VRDQTRELRKRYLREAVETATPAERLVMIYDRLCVDLQRAMEAFEKKNYYDVNQSLVHAQEIILALSQTLDTQKWKAAKQLRELYGYWHQELVRINIEKDPRNIGPIIGMVEKVADAWRAAKEREGKLPIDQGAIA